MSTTAPIDVVSRPSAPRSEAEELAASRKRGWALVWYSAALLVVAGVLTSASSSGDVWRAYGLACLVFGAAMGLGAAFLLLRERPTLTALPGQIVRGVRSSALRTNEGIVGWRDASAARRHGATRAGVGGLPGMGVSQWRVVRSEWTKLHSVRSTKIVLGVAVGLIVGLALLLAAIYSSQWDTLTPVEQSRFRPGTDPLSGVGLAQLAVGILGVLCASNEYSTGMIRSTLAAVPRRVPVLFGKLAVVSALVFVSSVVAMFVAFWISQAVLAENGLSVGLGEPYVLKVIFAAPVYLVAVAAVGLALGALLRHTAGAISALVGLLFLLPIVFALVPGGWSRGVTPYLFGAAGDAFWTVPSGGHQITSAAAAFVVLLAWVAAAFAGSCYRLLREDA
ncbi:MAG: ABC transporter permease subunit [Sporichthyaceae bacterium]